MSALALVAAGAGAATVGLVSHRLRASVPRRTPPRAAHRRTSPPTPVAWLAFGAVLTWVSLGLVPAVLAVVLALVAAEVRRAQGERRRVQAQAAAVPATVDLFRMCAGAGLTVASAVPVAAERAPPALRPQWAVAATKLHRGLPLAEVLADVAREGGPGMEPLTAALAQSARSGVPLIPVLDELAATSRDRRRRSAQVAARRLPVTMLAPLAACTLPAAIALAVVPVLVVSLSSLAL